MIMNRLTIVFIGLAKAARVLIMALLMFYSCKYGILFSVAGMPVIVLLLSALMILAFADVWRTISSLLRINN